MNLAQGRTGCLLGVGFGLLSLLAAPAAAQTLTVEVRNGQTGAPLADAFVMVGLAPGVPFESNLGWTGVDGRVAFGDPVLAQPQTVTAGAEGFGYTTLCDAARGTLTLALYPAVLDSLMGGTATRIQGTVSGVSTVSNDGNLDLAVVLPALSVSSYALQDMLPVRMYPDTVDFPIIGPVPLVSNLYMPDQVEYLFFTFSKSPYWMDVPGDRPTTFVSVAARVAITDILNGTAFQNAVIREIGVERDVWVDAPGPQTVTINSDLAVAPQLEVELRDVPDGAHVQAASAAMIMEDGIELAVGYDTRGDVIVRDAIFDLATRVPGGDISDAVNIAVGSYMDSSAAREYSVGIMDRSGFLPPHDVTFDSWMLVPALAHRGHLFHWEDPTNPGVSPPPTWTRSNIGLRAIDPQDSTIAKTSHWRVYAPAEPGFFRLPFLPDEAPGPWRGIPDPGATPEADQLYWEFIAANPPGDADVVLRDFVQGGTHWVSRWIPIELDPTGVAAESRGAARWMLAASPCPADGEIRIAWRPGDPVHGGAGGATHAVLEIAGADGRTILQHSVPPSPGDLRWAGRDQSGRPLPGGVYWARLRVGAAVLGTARIVRVR